MAHAALNPDQIIFKYSYQREDIKDNNLDDANLETRCPLDNGRHSGTPEQTVGQLDLLPLEIVNEILLSMDLPTLTNFRCINRRAMQLVDSLPQYRMVFKHCPNVLRAILSTNANSYDCRLLYNTLATTRCSSCSNFGSYLYLITCKRVCHLCFRRRPDYVPVAAHGASKITGVSKTQLDRVPPRHQLARPVRTLAGISQQQPTQDRVPGHRHATSTRPGPGPAGYDSRRGECKRLETVHVYRFRTLLGSIWSDGGLGGLLPAVSG